MNRMYNSCTALQLKCLWELNNFWVIKKGATFYIYLLHMIVSENFQTKHPLSLLASGSEFIEIPLLSTQLVAKTILVWTI